MTWPVDSGKFEMPAGGVRWDCCKSGCFNIKLRPKIGVFSDCFGGRISFGDIDGVVEVNNNFLFLEWKSVTGEPKISTGQHILFRNLSSRDGIMVVVVSGNAETMHVNGVIVYSNGNRGQWTPMCLDELKNRIAEWYRKSKLKKQETCPQRG